MSRVSKLCIILGLAIVSSSALATTNCQITLQSNDQIQWDVHTIEVNKACQTFSVTLVHQGKLSKEVMGHNWLLTKTEDKDAVIRALLTAKNSEYIKEDARIIAHTSLIGGGEQTTISFEVGKLVMGQKYSYFCSYPEHNELMQGTLILVE